MAHYRRHLVWSVDLNVNKKNYIYIKYIYKSISPKQISLTTRVHCIPPAFIAPERSRHIRPYWKAHAPYLNSI